MEQGTVNSIVLLFLGLFTGLLAYIFKTTQTALQKDIDECKRKYEMLEAKFHEFENEKYNKIMEALSGIKADVAVIKNEIDNLKKNGNCK